MVRVIKTTPSLRRAIERELLIQNRHEKENHGISGKENVKEKENHNYSLERMLVIALKRACDQLGVKYYQ